MATKRTAAVHAGNTLRSTTCSKPLIGASMAGLAAATSARSTPSRARPSGTPFADSGSTCEMDDEVASAQPRTSTGPRATGAPSAGTSTEPPIWSGGGIAAPSSMVGRPSTSTVNGSRGTPGWSTPG